MVHENNPFEPGLERRDRHAFSLLELLTVIAIISILMGILIAAAGKIKERSTISRVRSSLAALTNHTIEYEVATSKPVEHLDSMLFEWTASKTRNAPGATGKAVIVGSGQTTAEQNANLFVERFVWAAWQNATLRTALPSLGEDMFRDADGDGFLEVVDPWGNSFAYAMFVQHDDGNDTDDFLPQHSDPFFASAGPDGRWGTPKSTGEMSPAQWDSYIQTDQYKETLDNLYSYDLNQTAAVRGN